MMQQMEARTGMQEFRHGWPSLLACLLGQMIGVHALPPYTVGFFINPLQQAFGWNRTEVSFGVTVLTIAMAIGVPIADALINRWGERRLIAVGMIVLAAGYLALSAMGPSLTVFWIIMASMALFGAGCSPVTLSRILVGVFDRARGTALGITLIGTGLTGTLAPMVLAPIMAAYGWRAGYLVLALIMLVGLPILLGLLIYNGTGAKPSMANRQIAEAGPRLTIREALKTPLFLRLLITFFCIALAIGGVIVHFVPMLIDSGFTPARAGQTASLIGLSLIAGRLISGILVDRIFAPYVAMTLMGLSAIGFLILGLGGPALLPFAALLLGMSFGAEIDLIVYLTSRYFDPRLYGRIFGLLYASTMVGVAVSPVIYAQIRDMTGTYAIAFLGTAALLALSAALFATLPRFPGTRDRAQIAEPPRSVVAADL